MNFILHSSELHIGSSIRYENALHGNYFLNCYIVKIILISFNCFSEYRYEYNKIYITTTAGIREEVIKCRNSECFRLTRDST